jgi:parvulin-like peptidyl-prolyl isomerase
MVKVRQVVTRTKREAQGLLRRLSEGERMEELALHHSIAPDGKMKGEIGWIRQGEMEEEVGFHIFQVVSKRAEGVHFLPEVASEIERKLFSQRWEEFFSEWLKKIRDVFPVSINQDLLEKLEWA